MTESSNFGTRIGSAERDAALTALGDHMRAGRLDPAEYSERAERVAVARFSDDLVPLFADLPAGSGPVAPARTVSAQPGSAQVGPIPPAGGSLLERHGARVIAIAGPVCLALFFVSGFAFHGWAWAWLFFLVPGALGTVVYGDSKAGRTRGRDRKRDRR
ncbi:hypothetical protein BH10ACT8_BH10ACT8_09890 [soil metagenome]